MRLKSYTVSVVIACGIAGAAFAQPIPGPHDAPQAKGAPHDNRQVALKQALNELLDARHQLEADHSDTEGHREKAIGLIAAATNEVRAGLASDGHKF